MIYVMSEPTGKEYEKLMAYALQKSDAFSMVFCNYYNLEEYENRTRSIRASMERFLLKTRSDSQWPGTVSYDTWHKYTIVTALTNMT